MPDVVDMPGIATQLGAALGIGPIGGAILMGFIFMMLFLLPTLFFCNKYKMGSTYPTVIVGIGSLIASIPLFNFPSWIVLIIGLIVAFLFAGSIRDMLTGKGGGN